MKTILTLWLTLTLVFGSAICYGLASNSTTDSSSAAVERAEHLKNLNLLRSLAGSKREAQITSTSEIHKATIHGLDETEIPHRLIIDFDKIYAMIVHCLHLEEKGAKNVVWSMDLDSLQEMPSGKEACLGGCPVVLAALY